jgi:hypothetical protein
MKKILLFLMFLLPSLAQAQIIPTLPVTLTNGTLADANQVMSNFNTIVTGVNTNGAKNGANSDITALSALTTPITPAQGGSNVYIGSGSGAANTQLVVTPAPAGFALISGYTVNYVPSVSNTGPTTLSVGGTTATAVKRQTSAGLVPLVGGEIFINQMATVIYDGTQYELINSAVTANTQPCTSIDYAGITVPTGYLAEDGSAQSRSTFSALFGCLANTAVTATTTSGSPSVAVTSSTGYQVGWYVGGTNVTCNSTILSKADSTHITISNNAGGNGATTLTIGPYPQGDCSTTFNLPNYQGRLTAMADTAGGTMSSVACPNPASVGSQCGSTTQTIPLANLPTGITSVNASQPINLTSSPSSIFPVTSTGALASSGVNTTGPTITMQYIVNGTGAVINPGTINNSISVTSNNTNGTAFLLQPVGLVTKAIKF